MKNVCRVKVTIFIEVMAVLRQPIHSHIQFDRHLLFWKHTVYANQWAMIQYTLVFGFGLLRILIMFVVSVSVVIAFAVVVVAAATAADTIITASTIVTTASW